MHKKNISCRIGCGACCIAPSLSSSIPGMLMGKPAGIRCIQLSTGNSCMLFDLPERPSVCRSYQATEEYCGLDQGEAMVKLQELDRLTR